MTLTSYLQQFQEDSSSQNMPNARSEEYRYSDIIEALHTLEINPDQGIKNAAAPWKTDHLFINENEVTQLNRLDIHTLSSTFLRGKNYFKDNLLRQSSLVHYIEVNEKQRELSLGFLSTSQQINSAKIYVKVAAGSSLKLHIQTGSQADSLMIPMLFLEVDNDAELDIFYWPKSCDHLGILYPFFEASVQANSHINFYSFSKDLAYHRLNFYGYILGVHADISLHTSFYLKGKETADFFARIFHESPESTSNQHINTVAYDESRMNFNGQIAANKSAKQILAYQMFKGLLLGEKAHITARPQLDIEYYDLACSHGVSIGGFTQEELFYMKNRGLKEEEILPLLTYGFLAEPFVGLNKDDPWRIALKEQLSIS